jgi:Phosphotransferase enzyme family
MTSSSPLCPLLPLERKHLVAFAERHYGGMLHAIHLCPLRGGLQAAGVFRVEAQLRSPGGHLRPVQFVVKRVHSELRREWAVYRTLEAHGAEAIAPRLLDVIHLGATALLFLEWVRPVCAWPWRDVNAAGQVLVRLARLHQGPWKTGTAESILWAYDHTLHQSGQATLETLQRVVREQGAAQWQAAVPMTTRLVAALSEIRCVLLATSPHAVWIHGDMHPGNVIMRRGTAGVEPVLLDWARARPGSALEDVSAWVQSLGHWEPQARRLHDTLVRLYLLARGLEPVLSRDFRRLYWVAGACNALAGALQYHLMTFAQARTPTQQVKTQTMVQKWLRVIRRADASWHAG